MNYQLLENLMILYLVFLFRTNNNVFFNYVNYVNYTYKEQNKVNMVIKLAM